MQKLITLFLLLISFNIVNAQTDEQIINEILFDLFGFQQDTILIKSIKTKTYFEFSTLCVSIKDSSDQHYDTFCFYIWKLAYLCKV